MQRLQIVLFIAILFKPSMLLAASSFKCSKQNTTTEKVICADKKLAKKDYDLNWLYQKVVM